MMAEDVPPARTGYLRLLLPIAILAVAVAGAIALRDTLSFETLRANREALIAFRDAHYGVAALGLMLVYVGVVAFSLPGATVTTLAGGFLFGVFPGVVFNVLGATAGAILIFLAVRRGIGERLSAMLDASGGAVSRIRDGIRDNELSVLFLIRLAPAVPFVVANLIPALVGVSLSRFVFTTFFGIIPGALVYTSVGAGLGDVFERGETPDLGILFEPQIMVPILGLCVLAALPIVIKAVRTRRHRR